MFSGISKGLFLFIVCLYLKLKLITYVIWLHCSKYCHTEYRNCMKNIMATIVLMFYIGLSNFHVIFFAPKDNLPHLANTICFFPKACDEKVRMALFLEELQPVGKKLGLGSHALRKNSSTVLAELKKKKKKLNKGIEILGVVNRQEIHQVALS